MRSVLDELDPGEERRVEQRRRDLADPSPDGVLEPAVEDLRRGDEPLLFRALAEGSVERELLPGEDDRPIEQLGGPLDVRHARRAAGVVGREFGHELANPKLLGGLRGECRLGDREAGSVRSRSEVADERRSDPLRIELLAGACRDEPDGPARGHEARVGGRTFEATEAVQQGLPEPCGVENDPELATIRLRRHEPGERGDGERGGLVAEAHLTRFLEQARNAGRAPRLPPPTRSTVYV